MDNIIKYLLESSVCIGLFYALYWAFLKNETFFVLNRFYLILSLIASFIIPLFNIPSPLITNTISLRPDFSAQSPLPAADGFSLISLMLLIYTLGVIFFLFRFLVQLTQIVIVIKKNGINRFQGQNIVVVENERTPFSFFNLIFLNKKSIPPGSLTRIITHESIHIKQMHSIDLLIMELTSIFYWFNPFVWPYKKSLKEIHEYLADNAVIAQGCSTAGYQLLILEQNVGGKLFELANNLKQSQIKRRITMMTKIKSRKRAGLKVLLFLPLAAMLILVFADARTVINPVAVSDTLLSDSINTEQDKSAEELKMKQKKLSEIMKKLEAEYNETEDEAKKKEIKLKMMDLKKMTQEQKQKQEDERYDLIKKLKAKYEATEYEAKKKEIKLKVMELEKAIAMESQQQKSLKKIKIAYAELEEKLAATEDRELQEKIKQKMEKLKMEAESIKKQEQKQKELEKKK